MIGLGSILVLGITAQWLAWRLHLPSILLLLIAGFLAGPITGFLDPDALLGDLLFPVVSLSVAIILFEGGLSLNIRELKEHGVTIGNLITIGALVTWAVGTGAAYLLLGLDFGLSLLLGAVLIVTGPTVVIPLLLYIRPIGRVGSIAKWEGIVNDPIGAILAVLVFEILVHGLGQGYTGLALLGLAKALFFGAAIGVSGALIVAFFLKRFWLPDLLQEPVTLMIAIGCFVTSNLLQTESGLLATTVMGIALANQKWVSVKHIIEFKERLRVLLISGLFVLLAARMQTEDLSGIGWRSIAFLAVLILIARPLMVALSTIRSKLDWRERVFLAWLAPRGIVAAAISSLFALHLSEQGYPLAERLMPETFFVIIGTVVIYGLTAAPLARRLRLADSTPQGLLLVSAHKWAREIAQAVRKQGFDVILVDTNRHNVTDAKMDGLVAYNENIVTSPQVMDQVAMHSIGRLLALTPNDEANSLAALRLAEVFGRSKVYQLSPKGLVHEAKAFESATHLRGRFLFDKEATFDFLSLKCKEAGKVKVIGLTEKFTFRSFRELYGDAAVPLFLITEDRELIPFTTDAVLAPEPGHKLVALADSKEDYKKKE